MLARLERVEIDVKSCLSKTFKMGMLCDPACQHTQVYAKEFIAEVCQDLYTKTPHKVLILIAANWGSCPAIGINFNWLSKLQHHPVRQCYIVIYISSISSADTK